MPRKTLLTLPLLLTLASPVLADADKALLEKCDGMTRAGMIDPKLKDGVIGGFPEKRCAKEAELAKGKEELAKGKEESARLDAELAKLENETNQLLEIFAMLDAGQAKAYLKDEIQKAETNLAKAKENGDQRRAKSIEYRLNRLRAHQQKLK